MCAGRDEWSADQSALQRVRSAYGVRASAYIDLLGRIEHTAAIDRQVILTWARTLDGLLLDVGCGPGQWTDYLRTSGVEVEGIDPVPEFLDSARATYPASRYRQGSAEDLGVSDGFLGGVLSWYSLIHTEPERIDAPLAEFARGIRPGGRLLLGFFTGPRLEPFDHAVTSAWFWPVEELSARVEGAGFIVEHTETRTDPAARPHAAIIARRLDRSAVCAGVTLTSHTDGEGVTNSIR